MIFLPTLGLPGIVNTTDAYYTEAAREMLNRGDYLTPYLNYSPYYFKPILTYWLIIASYLCLGVSTFAARLPSALCAIGTALATWALCRPYIGQRPAFLAALALISMPMYVVVGHLSLTDMPLILLTTVTNLLLIGKLIRGSSLWSVGESSIGLMVAYVCLGLAILCKGPLALAVVAICVGGFLLATSESVTDFKNRIFSLKPLWGIAIPLAVALPWYIAEHFATNGVFTKFFFIEQNFGRLSGKSQSHINPPWFYLPYLAGGFIPWLPLLLSSPFVFRLNRAKRFSKNPRIQMTIASLCWIFGTLLLLHLSSSKVAHYLLPLAPPIAILAGLFLDTIIRLGRRRFILWGAPIMVLGGTVTMFLVPKMFSSSKDLQLIAFTCLPIFILSFAVYGFYIYRSKVRNGVIALMASALLTVSAMIPIGIQQVYTQGNSKFEYLVKITNEIHPASLAVLANESPTAAFYAKREIFEIQGPFDCRKFVETTKGPHYLIIDSKFLSLFAPFLPENRTVSTSGKWNLLRFVEKTSDQSNSQKVQ